MGCYLIMVMNVLFLGAWDTKKRGEAATTTQNVHKLPVWRRGALHAKVVNHSVLSRADSKATPNFFGITLGSEGCLGHMSTRWKVLDVNSQMDKETPSDSYGVAQNLQRDVRTYQSKVDSLISSKAH
jgi:hypothetical protein